MVRISRYDLIEITKQLSQHTGFEWVLVQRGPNAPGLTDKYAICPVDAMRKPLIHKGFRGDAKTVYNFAVGANVLGMISAGVHRSEFETVNTDTREIMHEIRHALTTSGRPTIRNVYTTYSKNMLEIETPDNSRYSVILEPRKCWSDKPEDQPKPGERTN